MILDQEIDDRIDDMVELQRTNLERYKYICELAGYRVDGVYELVKKAYIDGYTEAHESMSNWPLRDQDIKIKFESWLEQR